MLTEDPFLGSDGVRLALAMGADPSDPAAFFQALIDIIDNPGYAGLLAHLRSVGLSVGRLLDLVEPARIAEASADLNYDRKIGPMTLVSVEAKQAAVQLHARGFSSSQIARLLGVADTNVARFLSSRGTKIDEVKVIELHSEGLTPLEIEQRTGMSRPGVVSALQRLGVTPNVIKARVVGPTRERIIHLRNDGAQYQDIIDDTGATLTQIKSVLRLGAKKGLVRNYGQQPAAA